MKVREAIDRIDSLKHNTYTNCEKVDWLNRLDGMIKREIIDTHEGGEDVSFSGYNDDTPIDTELLIPHPYDEVYRFWLEAQIDYANGEYPKYNNSMAMFNTAYSAYERYYNRTHMPKGNKLKFF